MNLKLKRLFKAGSIAAILFGVGCSKGGNLCDGYTTQSECIEDEACMWEDAACVTRREEDTETSTKPTASTPLTRSNPSASVNMLDLQKRMSLLVKERDQLKMQLSTRAMDPVAKHCSEIPKNRCSGACRYTTKCEKDPTPHKGVCKSLAFAACMKKQHSHNCHWSLGGCFQKEIGNCVFNSEVCRLNDGQNNCHNTLEGLCTYTRLIDDQNSGTCEWRIIWIPGPNAADLPIDRTAQDVLCGWLFNHANGAPGVKLADASGKNPHATPLCHHRGPDNVVRQFPAHSLRYNPAAEELCETMATGREITNSLPVGATKKEKCESIRVVGVTDYHAPAQPGAALGPDNSILGPRGMGLPDGFDRYNKALTAQDARAAGA